MSAKFTQSQTPASVWLLAAQQSGGVNTETVSILSPAAPVVVVYSDATPSDTLPALTPAVIYGGSMTNFDPTIDVWLAMTVVGSAALSLVKEADVYSTLDLAGITYAILARLTRTAIMPYQQS